MNKLLKKLNCKISVETLYEKNFEEIKDYYKIIDNKFSLLKEFFPYKNPIEYNSKPILQRRNAISSYEHLYISMVEHTLNLYNNITKILKEDISRTLCIKSELNIKHVDDIICNYLNNLNMENYNESLIKRIIIEILSKLVPVLFSFFFIHNFDDPYKYKYQH